MLKNKGQQIVDAAIRRFIYYGIAKTTMEDIAQDIALAKPSLYHYFDSKNHLVRVVFDHVLNEYLCLLNAIKLNQSLERILDEVIKIQRRLFQKYALLGCSKDLFFNPKDKILNHKFLKIKFIHINFLTNVFHAESRKIEVQSENIDKLVDLYFSCMYGMFLNHFFQKQTVISIAHRQHLHLYQHARMFSSIFIKGLKV